MAILIGRTSSGTSGEFITEGDAMAWEFAADASGNVAVMWFQSKVANASPATTSVELGIYTDAGAAPGTLLGSGTNNTASEIQGTAPFSVTLGSPVAVVAATQYWLAISTAGAGGFDYQGTSSITTSIDHGANPLPGTWAQDENLALAGPIIYGEEAAALPVVAWIKA